MEAKPRRRRFRPPAWTHPLLAGGLHSIVAAVRAMGLDESLDAMRRVGGVYAHSRVNRVRMQRSLEHMAQCFPEWDHQRRMDVAVESYRSLFGLVAEMACAPMLFDTDGWPERIDLGDTMDAIDILFERRPSILISGHCGNWEALGATVAHFGFKLHALYRPLDLPPLDRWVRRTRARCGIVLLDKFGAARAMPEIVARGDPLGFIADQSGGKRGVFVPYFGRLASTYKSIGLLAMQHNAPVICGQAMRTRDPVNRGLRYLVDIVDVIHPHEWREQPDALFYITARYRRAIEHMVRRAPGEYLWMHRYWRKRPAFEREGKPFPPALREKLRSLPWMTDEELAGIEDRSRADTLALQAAR